MRTNTGLTIGSIIAVEFKPIEEDPDVLKVLSPLEAMNQEYSVIVGSGAHFVRETEDWRGTQSSNIYRLPILR